MVLDFHHASEDIFGVLGHKIGWNPSERPKRGHNKKLAFYYTKLNFFVMSSYSRWSFNPIVQQCVAWHAAFDKHSPGVFTTDFAAVSEDVRPAYLNTRLFKLNGFLRFIIGHIIDCCWLYICDSYNVAIFMRCCLTSYLLFDLVWSQPGTQERRFFFEFGKQPKHWVREIVSQFSFVSDLSLSFINALL